LEFWWLCPNFDVGKTKSSQKKFVPWRKRCLRKEFFLKVLSSEKLKSLFPPPFFTCLQSMKVKAKRSSAFERIFFEGVDNY